MTYFLQLGLMALASLLALYAVALLLRTRTKEPDVTGLPVFVLEPLYPAGYHLRKKFEKKDRSSRARYRKLLELYTPGEAERISRQASDAAYTYLLLFLPVLLMVLAITGDVLLTAISFFLLLGMCFYFDYWLSETVRKRHAKLRAQYPAMLTEMSLMVGVGITAGEAFERVAHSSDELLYREMQRVTESVKNGMPVDEALDTLSARAPLREMKKFVSLYKQNLLKGGPDFPRTLSEMATNAWTERKNSARTAGELAEQKLLLPTIFMFVGILLMIIVPVFSNLF